MRHMQRRGGLPTVFLLALALAGPLPAGEPIPDIDVIIEQNPGPHFSLIVRPPEGGQRIPVSDVDVLLQKIPSGLAFDGVRLSGDRALRELTIDDLPPGWGVQRKGRRLELSGPAVVPPARFQFTVGEQRPSKLDVELLADGKVGHARKGIVPREVPVRRVAGTLSGTVRLPPAVSPGETIALRALPESNLPPAGAWVISGTVSDPGAGVGDAVSEPWTDEELRATQRTILNTTRSNILLEADVRVTLMGDGNCDALAPTAAGLLARDNFETSKSNTIDWLTANQVPLSVERLPPIPGSDPTILAAPLPPSTASYHLLSRGKLGAGLRASYAFALADGADPGLRSGFAIKEEEMPMETGVTIEEEEVNRAKVHVPVDALGSAVPVPSGDMTIRLVQARRLSEISEQMFVLAALDAEPVARGCSFVSRQPTKLEQMRLARARTKKSLGQHFGTVAKGAAVAGVAHLLTLPSDLQPGESLSVRYLDEWGDPWVEVESVPDVEVVEPDTSSPPRRIESAGRYVVAGRSVCVCGGFDALDIATPFQVGEHSLQASSVGRTTAWLTVPEGTLGPQLIQVEGFAGEAATDAIRIAAELDQEHLFSGQQTPLRLSVQGSEQQIPLELTNRTPQIITVEGGDEQTLETPGGRDNSVVRQLSAQQRGSFQLFWEVPDAPCPCTEAPR